MFWLGFGIGFVSTVVGSVIAIVLLTERQSKIKTCGNSWCKYTWTINCPKCGTLFRYGFWAKTLGKDETVAFKCVKTVVGDAELRLIEGSN
jgi:hypothetical protein